MKNLKCFIACGQLTDKEKEIGSSLCEYIKSVDGWDSFFAEEVHDLEALTSKIFTNLNACSAFIAVLHNRDNTNCGSVWINQEIAIVSFVKYCMNKNIPTIVFIEKGVELEGLIKYLIANPVPYESNQEIIEYAKEWFKNIKDTVNSNSCIKVSDTIENLHRDMKYHKYRLSIQIDNISSYSIGSLIFDCYFPDGIEVLIPYINVNRIDANQQYVKYTLSNEIDKIRPGTSITKCLFDFKIDNEAYRKGLTRKSIKYKIFADNMEPVEIETLLEGDKRVSY